jgi:phosphoglycolate/pyridoxal phosphate phosphatase family enzyme
MISAGFDALVCDLDGVVYRGDEIVSGARDAIARLRTAGVQLLFCTNNSRATTAQYVHKLDKLGIPIDPREILTSAIVTAETLTARGFAGKTAIVVGGDGIRQALSDVCISVKDDPSVTVADAVVVGWHPEFDYDEMRRAATAVRRGATFIATNDDATFPASDGLWPGAGAILASIEKASGGRAEVMGKPHDPMMTAAAARLSDAKSIAIVGDRPDTDLAGGTARGWTTILVLTGVTSENEARDLSPQPDHVIGSIAELGQ